MSGSDSPRRAPPRTRRRLPRIRSIRATIEMLEARGEFLPLRSLRPEITPEMLLAIVRRALIDFWNGDPIRADFWDVVARVCYSRAFARALVVSLAPAAAWGLRVTAGLTAIALVAFAAIRLQPLSGFDAALRSGIACGVFSAMIGASSAWWLSARLRNAVLWSVCLGGLGFCVGASIGGTLDYLSRLADIAGQRRLGQ